MSSNYPTGLDTLSISHQDNTGEKIRAATINDLADAINKIELELGVSPSGSAADLATRLASGALPVSGVTIADSSFVNSYDTALWIAPTTRTNPIKNFQGLYIQARLTGNLGGFVHDAGASELRLNNVSNPGTSENAFEASLVVSGGANTLSNLYGVLANFHTEGTPSGAVSAVGLIAATTVPALTGTMTIGTLYSAFLQAQTVASNNYTLWLDGGNSVIKGQVVPPDTSTGALILRALAGQTAGTPLLSVQNSTPTTLFQVTSSGTGGIGGVIGGTSWWINNNNATVSTVGVIVRGKSGQTADLVQWQDATPTTHLSVTAGGLLRWNAAGDVQTTVGAAGAASALPATPSKYLKVVGNDGVTYVIPAYAAV